MKITQGKISVPQKVLVYGPEGIGKSTFASQFPDPLFIDTEGSTKHLDVKRLDTPSTWKMLLDSVEEVAQNPGCCKTLVIDTIDWAESLASRHVIAEAQKGGKKVKGIEDFGYAKGYVYLSEELQKLLNLLTLVIYSGANVLLVAHAQMRKFENPDEMGAYDRWELKLQRRCAPIVKEWCDAVIFVNYETIVVRDESTGSYKAQGGKRTMYACHTNTHDAKNRHGLPEEMPFEYAQIACIFEDVPEREAKTAQLDIPEEDPIDELYGLMVSSQVTEAEVQAASALTGVISADIPLADYNPQFIQNRLIKGWSGVVEVIKEKIRKEN